MPVWQNSGGVYGGGAGAAYMGMGAVHPAMPIVVQACVRMLCALGVPFLWRLHSIMPLPPCAWV